MVILSSICQNVLAIIKAGYKYFTTKAQNTTSRTNPFSEPVNVYSNINNGTGIFAGCNSYKIKI